MIAAMIIPASADELTLADALQRAAERGLVPCAPKNFSVERDFTVTFFHPSCIPATWRRLVVAVKTPSLAKLGELPCAS